MSQDQTSPTAGTQDRSPEAVLEKQLRVETMRAERAVVQALSGMYRSATDSRLRKDLRTARGSEDAIGSEERDKIVNVSRALLAQSPVYEGFVDRMIDFTVGTGLVPVGEGKDTPADEAARLFMQWADNEADSRGLDHFGEMQRKVVREMLAFGDSPVVKVMGTDGRQSVQIVPSALLVSPSLTPNRQNPSAGRPRLSGGVEMTADGRPLRYHFARYDDTGLSVSTQTKPVDAEYVLFVALRRWAHQTRGLPWLASVLERFLDLNEFVDAVVTAAKLQAALAMVVTSKSPGATQSRLTAGTQSVPGLGDSAGSDRVRNLGDMKPGQVLVLPQGDDAKAVQGSQPNASFDSFTRGIIMMACAGAGMPYEIAVGDFSKANFSVSRMARIAARQTALPVRQVVERSFCRRLFEWRIDWLIARGELRASLREEYLRVRWQAPAMVPVDPEAEARAAILEVENNLTTKQAVVAERGLDLDAVLVQRSAEKQQERDLDVVPPSTPGSVTPGSNGNPDSQGDAAAA